MSEHHENHMVICRGCGMPRTCTGTPTCYAPSWRCADCQKTEA